MNKEYWMRARIYALLAILVGLLSVGLLFALATIVPASPVHFYGAAIKPLKVCPAAPVQVIVDYEIDNTYPVKQIEVTSTWKPIGEGLEVYPRAVGRFPDTSPTERTKTVSPVLRIAPTVSGTYQLQSEAQVIFTVYGVPRFEDYPYTVQDELIVLENSDPECEKSQE